MSRPCKPNCDGLVLLSALVSVQIAKNLTADELELLSAFFEVLGDNLALLALCPGNPSDPQEGGPAQFLP